MVTTMWIRRTLSISSILAIASLARADTWVVGNLGGDDFTDIQPAVDAASDGDTILVRPGTYSDFTIDNKSLFVFRTAVLPNPTVNVAGTIVISNLAKQKRVVMSGISATGRTLYPTSVPALVMTVNIGAVRIQNGTFKGGAGIAMGPFCLDEPYGSGGLGADVFFCTDLAFNGCTFLGGDGFGQREASCFDSSGGHGGHGVEARTSQVALYDCVVTGGKGGWVSDNVGGNGGNAYQNPTGGFFASGTTFQGGAGGNVSYFNFRRAGNGGHGIFVGTNGNAVLLDDTPIGGVRGVATFSGVHGQPGLPITGAGSIDQLSGTRRKCTATAVATAGNQLIVTVAGQPGDQVFLPWSNRSAWAYLPEKHGTRLIPNPTKMFVQPIGVIPASGSLTTMTQLAPLPAGLETALTAYQCIVIDAQGDTFLGSPMHVLRQ